MPSKSKSPLLSPKFALALQFANEIHGTQIRKGIGAPYISHLMTVSATVLEYGGNETEAIAALLHDSAEDCGGKPMLETVRVMFGDDVASIVESCTDTFEDPKPDWKPRKTSYLRKLGSKPHSAKLVACSDKLHNLSSTLRDIDREGVKSWTRRMAKSPNGAAEKQVWYYLGCLRALSKNWNAPILAQFSKATVKFCELAGADKNFQEASRLELELQGRI